MTRTRLICASIAAWAIASAGHAAATCSIHPAKDTTDAQLPALAKVSQADAEKKALARVKVPAKVLGSALQVENGCLFWMLVVKETGKSGVQELKVDAGTGKVLASKHESGK
jgi:uncharacterized membrane protein YkoI